MFLDEVMFTYSTIQERDYSAKGENLIIPEKTLKGKTYAVIMCVSADEGVEYYEVYEKAIDVEYFMEFLRSLRQYLKGQKFSLFLDNLRVHHSRKVKEYCDRKGIGLVFNLAYSPEYNPIETVFSLLKAKYKKEKHISMVKEGSFQPLQIITESIEDLNKDTVKKISAKGLKQLTDLS